MIPNQRRRLLPPRRQPPRPPRNVQMSADGVAENSDRLSVATRRAGSGQRNGRPWHRNRPALIVAHINHRIVEDHHLDLFGKPPRPSGTVSRSVAPLPPGMK